MCGVSDSLGCVSRREIFAGMKVSSLLYTQVRLPTKHNILVLRNFFADLIQYVSVALLVVNIIILVQVYTILMISFSSLWQDVTPQALAPNEGSARGPSALVE